MKNAHLLRDAGLKAKKSFGQNFLEDAAILGRIKDACALRPGTAAVEIGAGLGALTAVLAETGAHIYAVERDRDLCPLLRQRFANAPNVTILEANAMTLDLAPLAARHGPLTLCGNLPYHLTSPLIFGALDQLPHWTRLVVMVQREVAHRMSADPGSRTFGLLTVLLGGRLSMGHLFDVPPHAFHPAPKVHSAVVRLTPRPTPLPGAELPAYAAVARASFSARRKTLRNTLRLLGLNTDALCAAAGVDPGARAETLSLLQFGRLAQVATDMGWKRAPGARDEAALEDADGGDGNTEPNEHA